METVDVPTAWVSSLNPVRLELCARHGKPAEDDREVEFKQKTPEWVWATLPVLIGAAGLAIIVLRAKVSPVITVTPLILAVLALDRKMLPPLKVDRWPFCAQCLTLGRLGALGITLGILGLISTALIALRLANGGTDRTTLSLLLVLIVVMMIGVAVKEKYAWRRIARGHASKDQRSVRVKAHDRFAAAVRTQLIAEREAAGAQPTRQ
ncbi:hypothetical protein AB0E12_33115 [Micromonospora chersina]|uniref:hypothetical protein n=1 Tax=Micromonospora chersina TaxID=47854 RepID=UPI0034018FBA